MLSRFEQLRLARDVVRREGETLLALADRLGESFLRAVELVDGCRACVLVCGMGKAGLIGQKISATLASTGVRGHFLHPAEALHGDLGRVCRDDVLVVLSHSGQTEEITRLLPSLTSLGVPLVAITARVGSPLGRAATVVVDLGPIQEADPLGLAPTASTTAMLAVGDALALVVSRRRGFGPVDFARNHPGGNLGLRLSRVEDQMRPAAECRIAIETATVREVFVERRTTGRRSGAIMLVDADGRLSGVFTDSDLARLLENRRETALDSPISGVMTRNPKTITVGALMPEAIQLLAAKKISELPVVDAKGAPVGMIDITDIVGAIPTEPPTDKSRPALRISMTDDGG